MNVRFVTKAMFFDRQAVLGAVDKAARKVLSKFGAFVRRGARGSIRQRKRISEPGKPPSGHVGLLKRLILFGYDAQRRSVVIGPMPLARGSDAPALLEYGGTVRRQTNRDRKGNLLRRPVARTMHYRPRPYMGPAFDKEKSKLPAMWADSVK